jgi:hypothetical protein
MTPIESHSVHRRLKAAAAVLLLGLSGALIATVVRAEVIVAGTTSAVRIRASNDSIAEILSVMAKTLGVRYSASIPLNEIVSGTYSGSLSEALSSLLDGYNYVIRHDGGATDIVVVGKRGAHPAAAASAPVQAPTFASKWRREAAPNSIP